jgi:hypothetical protein
MSMDMSTNICTDVNTDMETDTDMDAWAVTETTWTMFELNSENPLKPTSHNLNFE